MRQGGEYYGNFDDRPLNTDPVVNYLYFFPPGEDKTFLVLHLVQYIERIKKLLFLLGGEGRIREILSGDL